MTLIQNSCRNRGKKKNKTVRGIKWVWLAEPGN